MKHLLLLSVVIAFDANAQHVYKCVEGKQASYQSEPCATAKAITKVWQATPYQQPSVDEQWQRYRANKKIEADRQYMRQRVGASQSTSAGASVPLQSGSACEAAKRYRESTLNAVGINRTHDLLRQLDDGVYRACK